MGERRNIKRERERKRLQERDDNHDITFCSLPTMT